MIINVNTKKKFRELLNGLHKRNYNWLNGDSLKKIKFINEYWNEHKKNLVIVIKKRITYCGFEELTKSEKIKGVEWFDDAETMEKLLMVCKLENENDN